MKIFNLTMSILLFAVAVTALVFTVKFDEAKTRLIENPETKAANLVKLAAEYDNFLNVNPTDAVSKNIRRDTLALNEEKNQGITRIKQTLKNFQTQFDNIKIYRDNLVKTIIGVSEALELPITQNKEDLEKVEIALKSAGNLQETLTTMSTQVQQIQTRDEMIYRELTNILEKLNREDRIPFKTDIIVKLKSLDGENADVFVAIQDQLTKIANRKSQLADYIGQVAAAAQIDPPVLTGKPQEAAAAIEAMFTAIGARMQTIATKESELESLKRTIQEKEDLEASRLADQKLLENWKEYLHNYLTEMAKEMYENATGEELIKVAPTIIQFDQYKDKYTYLRGTIIKTEPKWKTVQMDIGRAYIIEAAIPGTGKLGRAVKVRAPVIPGYILDVYRGKKKIGEVLITSVTESSSIGHIQNFTEIIKAGDTVRFSLKELERIDNDLSGGANKAPSGESTDGSSEEDSDDPGESSAGDDFDW